jgi:hypothetical protein
MKFLHSAMPFAVEGRESEISPLNCLRRSFMPDPNLPLLEDAAHKLAPFLNEVVFVGGVARQVVENMFGTAEGWFSVYDPVLMAELPEETAECLR